MPAKSPSGWSARRRRLRSRFCASALILRVVGNLIGKAIKSVRRARRYGSKPLAPIGVAEVSVRDEGPGIPAEVILHVLERYWQHRSADRHGSGLGLYISKGILEAHGGTILIDSRQAAARPFASPGRCAGTSLELDRPRP